MPDLTVAQIQNTARVAIDSPLANGGFLVTSPAIPIVQAYFLYAVNPDIFIANPRNGASLNVANAMIELHSGTAANGIVFGRTVREAHLRPGQGVAARLSVLFSPGSSQSTQYAGVLSTENGFAFGYQGTNFGILHRYGGQREIRTLTVTAGTAGAENVTVTLDGVAQVVPVASGQNATQTANALAAFNYLVAGVQWEAYAVANTVIFYARSSAPRVGAFTMASSGTAAGTFAQTTVGVVPTETFTLQANWNVAPLLSGSFVLDPTKGNIYQIQYRHGFGRISFFLTNPNTGLLTRVHEIPWLNAQTIPSLQNPNLPLALSASNSGNTTDKVVRAAQLSSFLLGEIERHGPQRSQSASKASIPTTLTPLFSIRNNPTFAGKINTTEVFLTAFGAALTGNQAGTVVLVRNATLTGAVWGYSNQNESTVGVDTTATAMTGGTQKIALSLGQQGDENILLKDFNLLMAPGDVYTLAVASSSGTTSATGSMSWIEEQ